MVVGAALIDLHVHASQSLKQKRGVVRSIVQRLRNRFNLSVAEVGGQGTWQRAVLGLSAAGSSAEAVRTTLERAVRFVEDLHLAEVLAHDVELVELAEWDGPAELPEMSEEDFRRDGGVEGDP